MYPNRVSYKDRSPRRLRRVAPGWKSVGEETVAEHSDAGGGAADVGVKRRLSEEGGGER